MNIARFTTALTLSSVLVIGLVTPTSAAPTVLEKKFGDCAALNKVFPGGVAKNSKVTNKGGSTKYKPAVKPKVYKANSSKDRDKDGIACER